MPKSELIEIVCRASSIAERLGDEFLPHTTPEMDGAVEARMERWCRAAAGGDWRKFEQRLAHDNLDPTTARRALRRVRLRDSENLPAWAETLGEVLKAARAFTQPAPPSGGTRPSHPCRDAAEPIPFEHAFLPFVEIARRKLIARAGSAYQLLSEEAHAHFERKLLKELSHLCSRALLPEFSIFRGRRQTLPALFGVSPPEETASATLYGEFIAHLYDDGWLSFLREYAALARLAATVTDLWTETTGEFLCRLETDWGEISETFGTGEELARVVAVRPGLSDRHRGGRSVIALTFASGLRLIYKPKDLGMERAYFGLLEWLNQTGAPLPFKTLKVIDRSAYGWVEFVEPGPCRDRREVGRYYRRAGMLLCLVYVLEGVDCQRENIIACGEHPVLIDTETLMYPYARESEERPGAEDVRSLASSQVVDSVLSTNLLPQWQVGLDGRSYDVSGLGGMAGQEMPFRARKWKDINTDRMTLDYEYGKLTRQDNMPSLDGAYLSPNDYAEEVVEGFRRMYDFLLNHREELLAAGGPLSEFAHQRVRFVFRPTKIYGVLLKKMLDPQFLRDGADLSIHLDILSRTLVSTDSYTPFWPLLKEEQKSLGQWDVPFFTASTDSDALRVAPGQTIEKCFTAPTYDLVVSRLSRLCVENAEIQEAIIRGSLHARALSEAHRSAPARAAHGPESARTDAAGPLSREEFVREAVALAEGLRKRAVRSNSGGATWIALVHDPFAQRYQLQPIGYGLYDGSCGVALFLAALERVTGGAGFRDLALAALEPLDRDLRDSTLDQLAPHFGPGGGAGCGPVIYALVRAGQLLNEPRLLAQAARVASLLTRERLVSDQKFDIIFGAAGTILGLLALSESTGDREALAQAVVCGEHLLRNRAAGSSGRRAWRSSNGQLLTGFSHGAAGIAYALLRLSEATGRTDFREAALEANAYESDVFVPAEANWPDFRFPLTENGAAYRCAWCHGAAGIGLARVGGLSALDTPEVRKDIEAAIETTLRYGLQDIDHLCCGNLGRVEFLFTAARRLSRPQLLETAGKQASLIISRARSRNSYGLTGAGEPAAPGLFPGFHQGESGVGYELLRLAEPEAVPSALLLE